MPKKKRKTRPSTDTQPQQQQVQSPVAPQSAPPSQDSSSTETPQLPVHDRARIDKLRGDEEYHRGNFSAAISYYTKAIALSGSNPFFLVTLFTNRAISHIHMKEYPQAVEDCNVAIRLDPTHVRAYMCRAFASFYLQRFTHALNDYERASNLQPENIQLRQKLQKAKEAFEAFKKKPQNTQKQKTKTEGEWSGWMEDIDVNLALVDESLKQEAPASNGSGKHAEDNQKELEDNKVSPAATVNTNSKAAAHSDAPPPQQPQQSQQHSTATTPPNGDKQGGKLSPSTPRREGGDSSDLSDCPLLVPVGEALDAYPSELENLSPAQAKELAFKEKELGNNAFTAGDYLVALVHYSRAIKLYSREPIFFSNRALVYLKLQRYYESISDCTASIDRKPSIKAYARRATAWISLKEHTLAAEDYRKALKFESKNQDCLDKLIKCLSFIEEDCLRKLQTSPNNDQLKRDLQKVKEEIKRLNALLESRATTPPTEHFGGTNTTKPTQAPSNSIPPTESDPSPTSPVSTYPKRPTQW